MCGKLQAEGAFVGVSTYSNLAAIVDVPAKHQSRLNSQRNYSRDACFAGLQDLAVLGPVD